MSQTNAQNSPYKKLNRDHLKSSIKVLPWIQHGKVCDVVGIIIEANMSQVSLGTLVDISLPNSSETIMAEVVGFNGDKTLLLPYDTIQGIAPGSIVKTREECNFIKAHDKLLGKIIDPFMNSLSGVIPQEATNFETIPLEKSAPNPMERETVRTPLSLGIRAMDSLLTFGDGQRVGLMAGSGVGKSVLMGMIARGSDADVNIIALIGERGREVREFIDNDLGEEGLKKSIVVVVTSDKSPLMKVRGAKVATALAEYFSSKGKKVLLMMDSLTRVAMAQREIGLAIGEPPTTKGYTPSVFSLLPRLLERAGPQKKSFGAISAFYTVLVDGDDFNDPIADSARSILDGHINLSRDLAARGHFPAIDIRTSASRVMNNIVSKDHWQLANKLRSLISVHHENYDLVQIGAYVQGTNPRLDEAINLMPAIERFLKQDIDEKSDLSAAIVGLRMLLSQTRQGENRK